MANTAETIDIEKTSDSQDVDACVEEHVFGEVASATATLKLASLGKDRSCQIQFGESERLQRELLFAT